MPELDRQLTEALVVAHPAEAAQVMGRFPLAEGAQLLAELPPAQASKVLGSMTPPAAGAMLLLLDRSNAAALLRSLPPDTAASILRPVEAAERSGLLGLLDEDVRGRLEVLLQQPGGTAGALADPRVLSLTTATTVGDALEAVRGRDGEAPDYVFVVDAPATFVGQIATPELTRFDPAQRLGDVVVRDAAAVHAQADARAIMTHEGWQSHHALPVVDGAGRLLGAISFAVLRRLEQAPPAQQRAVSSAISLGELYWLGLPGVLDGLGNMASAPAAAARARRDDRS